jgi:hypothetical protein
LAWFFIGAARIGAFFVMRSPSISFWVTAVTVCAVDHAVLLTTAAAPSPPAADSVGEQSPRAEPFLLTEADLLAGKAVSGFTVVPGQSIGGGRFPRMPLLSGENVLLAVSGGHGGSFLRASLGYLVLTDRRLVFAGEKPLLDTLAFLPFRANLRELSLPFAIIDGVELQRRLNLSMQFASFRPALVIRTTELTQHVFWPNVFDLAAFAARIEGSHYHADPKRLQRADEP